MKQSMKMGLQIAGAAAVGLATWALWPGHKKPYTVVDVKITHDKKFQIKAVDSCHPKDTVDFSWDMVGKSANHYRDPLAEHSENRAKFIDPDSDEKADRIIIQKKGKDGLFDKNGTDLFIVDKKTMSPEALQNLERIFSPPKATYKTHSAIYLGRKN